MQNRQPAAQQRDNGGGVGFGTGMGFGTGDEEEDGCCWSAP